MIAHAHIALGGASLTPQYLADGKLADCERADVVSPPVADTGDTRSDWVAAKAATPLPAGALVMYWIQGE